MSADLRGRAQCAKWTACGLVAILSSAGERHPRRQDSSENGVGTLTTRLKLTRLKMNSLRSAEAWSELPAETGQGAILVGGSLCASFSPGSRHVNDSGVVDNASFWLRASPSAGLGLQIASKPAVAKAVFVHPRQWLCTVEVTTEPDRVLGNHLMALKAPGPCACRQPNRVKACGSSEIALVRCCWS